MSSWKGKGNEKTTSHTIRCFLCLPSRFRSNLYELKLNIVTVVKYKVKDGYVDDFIKAINEYDYSKALSMRLISTSDNEFISIMEYDEIDKTGDDEVDGVNWLDTVEHMLEFYGESRTDSCSGLVLAAHDQ